MTKNKYKNVRKSNVCPITDIFTVKTDRFFCEFLSIFFGTYLSHENTEANG